MNKVVIVVIIVAVLAVAVGAVGYVSAQTPNPQTPGQGRGFGMMGGRGPRAGMMSPNLDQDGPMHDAMIAAIAQALGLPVDELNSRLAKGETMAQIAASKGLTAEQVRTLMLNAHNQALDQAVKDGILTQTQAEWMKQRGMGMGGLGAYGMGRRGAGMGGFMNPDCPMHDQDETETQSN